MARKKEYIEEEVIEKAMDLFWRNGFESTSVRMLEKEMGINQFSIYSSFGSKNGVLLESIKCYKKKLNRFVEKLKRGSKGVEAIKDFFCDFLAFSQETSAKRGCLIVNTANELGDKADALLISEINGFVGNLKSLFIEKLKEEAFQEESIILKKANFLIIALQGLAIASKVYEQKVLDDFIETTFESV